MLSSEEVLVGAFKIVSVASMAGNLYTMCAPTEEFLLSV